MFKKSFEIFWLFKMWSDPLASRMPPFGALVYHLFQKLDYSACCRKLWINMNNKFNKPYKYSTSTGWNQPKKLIDFRCGFLILTKSIGHQLALFADTINKISFPCLILPIRSHLRMFRYNLKGILGTFSIILNFR